MNLRLGLILHHVENAPYADNSETLYYGSVIKDPDLGIRYTFAKSPNGDITLLQTESTGEVLEAIDKLIEVATESTWEPNPSKLTFLVKWDDVDYVYTWNDRNIDQFKIMVDDRFNELKPYVSTVMCDGNKGPTMPFIQDNAVAVTFEFTTGRSIKYLNKLIPELFRRIFDEHLIIDNKIEELMNDKFLILDKLKANDSRQDNEVVKAAVADAYAHAVRKNIEDWLDKYNNLFQPRHVRITFDLSRYQTNQKCYIKLISNVLEDEPVIESDIFNDKGTDAIFTKHTTSGMVIKQKIRCRTGNQLNASEDFSDHTFIANGGTKLVIYTSSKNTQVQVSRTSTAENNRVKDVRNQSEIISNYNINNELLMIRESDQAAIYPTLSGTPPKEGPVAYIYDWIWRAATINHWGSGGGGTNTQALQEDRTIGDWCNTRKTFTMMDGVTVEELVNNYETLDIYIDLYCAVASGGGDGGIRGVFDATQGRLSYQGYAVRGDNVASIPANKLKVPLKMTDLASTVGCFRKVTINCKDLKMDGTWLLAYDMPRANWNKTIGQWRRKGRVLGLLGWKYYLRVRPETKELEMLVNYDQQADGDSGNRCYTQGASRDSYFIYGNKRNTLKVDMKDKWTNKVIASYPATEYKQITPSLKIEDIENNYIGYLPLKTTATKNTYKVTDIISGQDYYAVAAQVKSTMSVSERMLAPINNKENVYTKTFDIVNDIPDTSSIYNMSINLLSEFNISNNKEEIPVIEEYTDNIKYDEYSEPKFSIKDNKYYILDTKNKLVELEDNFTEILKDSEAKTDGVKTSIVTNMNTEPALGRTVFMSQNKSVELDIKLDNYYTYNNNKTIYDDNITINLDKTSNIVDEFDIILNINNDKTVVKRTVYKEYNKDTKSYRIYATYIIPPYLNKDDYIVDINVTPNYSLINKEGE